jgi:glycosyltransferase involved in cell wall biosynthesis
VERSRLAIVIPAFNEAAVIGSVVARAARFGIVIVADDASTDATAGVARQAGADVVRLERNGGYDRALQAGVERAKHLDCGCFLTMDADGQHDPDVIERFTDAIGSGADLVVGTRDRFQRFAEAVFSVFGRRLWGMNAPLCGMKCYRMSVYDSLGHFDSYGSIGTELAIHAARRGCVIVNIPILTRPRVGASRFGAGLRANLRILRALVRGLRGRAPASACGTMP